MTNEDGKTHSKAPTYGKVFVDLMHDLNITDGAVRLFAHMHWRYGKDKKNFEGQTSMAQFMGVSEKTIRNRIDELEANDWVVTVYIELEGNPGRWQNCFYHVFEDKEECQEFRKTYQTQEREKIKPKPEARERKSRKGAGNSDPVRPNSGSDGGDTTRPNSSSTAQQNSGSDGHKNSGSIARQNSSSEYPSVVNPAKANLAIVNPKSSSLPTTPLEPAPAPEPATSPDDDDVKSSVQEKANGAGDKPKPPNNPPREIPPPPDDLAHKLLHEWQGILQEDYRIVKADWQDDFRKITIALERYQEGPTRNKLRECREYKLREYKQGGSAMVSFGYVLTSLENHYGKPGDANYQKPDDPNMTYADKLKSSPYASFYNNTPDDETLPEAG